MNTNYKQDPLAKYLARGSLIESSILDEEEDEFGISTAGSGSPSYYGLGPLSGATQKSSPTDIEPIKIINNTGSTALGTAGSAGSVGSTPTSSSGSIQMAPLADSGGVQVIAERPEEIGSQLYGSDVNYDEIVPGSGVIKPSIKSSIAPEDDGVPELDTEIPVTVTPKESFDSVDLDDYGNSLGNAAGFLPGTTFEEREEARIEAERVAEEARLEAIRVEEERVAEEARLEAARIAAAQAAAAAAAARAAEEQQRKNSYHKLKFWKGW
jgi:hypothetical protein